MKVVTNQKAAPVQYCNQKSGNVSMKITCALIYLKGFDKPPTFMSAENLIVTPQAFNPVFDTQDTDIQLMTPLVFASVEQPIEMPPIRTQVGFYNFFRDIFNDDLLFRPLMDT